MEISPRSAIWTGPHSSVHDRMRVKVDRKDIKAQD